ncbi:MAG: GNAT family N-acetyltransferase [Betaproteobacteria bacterium]|nr:GNAT family N-acetyltransferase [Betaproteobacteria bacterium]
MKVILRELERSDLAILNSWRNDHATIDQLGSAFRFVGTEVDEKWFEGYLASRSHNVRLAICDEKSRKVIGAAYLLEIDWISRSAEFAIWIGEATARGKGAGETATRAMLRHAFHDLNLHRVHLAVIAGNKAAAALYRKIGFVQEGVRRQALFKNGKYVDVVEMAILSSEFKLK